MLTLWYLCLSVPISPYGWVNSPCLLWWCHQSKQGIWRTTWPNCVSTKSLLLGLEKPGMFCWWDGKAMKHQPHSISIWLVVWNVNFMTFHILAMSSSQLTSRGVGSTTNQYLCVLETSINHQHIELCLIVLLYEHEVCCVFSVCWTPKNCVLRGWWEVLGSWCYIYTLW